MNQFKFKVSLLAIVTVLGLGGMAQSAEASFTLNTPVSDQKVYSQAMTLGKNGLPVMVYYDYNDGKLYLAYCDDAACSTGMTYYIGRTASKKSPALAIALGKDGYPVVSYVDYDTKDLLMITCTNATCCENTVKTIVSDVSVSSIALDMAIGKSTGAPMFLFYDTINSQLKLKICSNPSCSSAWGTFIVSGQAYLRSLALTAYGDYPVVSYRESVSPYNVKIFACYKLSCTTPTVATIGASAVDSYTDIAVGSDGKPVISYDFYNTSSGKEELKVTRCKEKVCTNYTTAIVDTGVLGSSKIILDKSKKPRLSYHYVVDGKHTLKYAKCADTNCTTNTTFEIVNDSITLMTSEPASIVIDNNDKIIMAWSDFTTYDLKTAKEN